MGGFEDMDQNGVDETEFQGWVVYGGAMGGHLCAARSFKVRARRRRRGQTNRGPLH